MWMFLTAALAGGPHISGGMGIGVMNPSGRLLGTPWGGAVGSVEVTELIEPVPWLGFGADTLLGSYPAQCDTCEGYLALRQGLGPVFRSRRGLVHVGARYAIGTISIPQQNKLRPFIKSVAVLPAGPLDFRVGLWAEGLPTEVGLSIELGWWLQDGQFRVSRGVKKPVLPGG